MGMVAKAGSWNAFGGWNLVSSKQDSISVKLEYTGIPIFAPESIKRYHSPLYTCKASNISKELEGRKLNE